MKNARPGILCPIPQALFSRLEKAGYRKREESVGRGPSGIEICARTKFVRSGKNEYGTEEGVRSGRVARIIPRSRYVMGCSTDTNKPTHTHTYR